MSAAPTEMTSPIAKLSFWGVRGSTPTVDPATWRFGGNTPCLELIAPDGTQLILEIGVIATFGNDPLAQLDAKKQRLLTARMTRLSGWHGLEPWGCWAASRGPA